MKFYLLMTNSSGLLVLLDDWAQLDIGSKKTKQNKTNSKSAHMGSSAIC